MDYDTQFEKIVDMQYAIPMDGSISMLTGSNGSGKSFVRKLLKVKAKKHDKKVVHASMQLRTSMHAELGGLGCLFHDREDQATSSHSVYLIQTACKSIHGGYLCLDEIEIGMGEETIMGIINWLNENLRNALKDTLGCLIITHNRLVVQHVQHDHWFNLDGYQTEQDWLNRKIVPTNLDQLRADDIGFYRYVLRTVQESKDKK